MVELIPHGVYLLDGQTIVENAEGLPGKDEARENTIAYSILRSHDVEGGKGSKLKVRFDAMASHDITYVGIIPCQRTREVPDPLRYDQLPQLPLRCRWHHQRG